MICHLSNTRKYCQIGLILPELCDPKVIYRENTKKLFPQSNIMISKKENQAKYSYETNFSARIRIQKNFFKVFQFVVLISVSNVSLECVFLS